MNNFRETVLNREVARSGKRPNRLAWRSNVLYAEGINKGALFMKATQSKQTGFSIIEALIAVVAVGAIATAGLLVYQYNQVRITDAAPSSGQLTNQQTTTTTPTVAHTIVKIPELGIQITVPDSIKDVTYTTTKVKLRNGNPATIAYFSTTSLTAQDSHCGTNSGPLGSLEKASGQYPTQSQDETNVLDYGQLVKQFPTFYITVGYPNAGCSISTSASTAANVNGSAGASKTTFSTALPTIQPLN
jgi:hypothetical protein